MTFQKPMKSLKQIDQTMKTPHGRKTLLTISASSYSFKVMRVIIIMSNLGINIHTTNDGYCVYSKDDNVIITKELAKVLGIPSYLLKGKYYPITWPSYKFHVYCDIGTSSSVLGQIMTVDNKLAPTNLLAVVPSKSGFYPSCSIQAKSIPTNYITLSVLDEDGKEPKWSGVPFRISLRIMFYD